MRPSARWRRLVRNRLAEMDRLAPGGGAVGAEYWNSRGRARRFHQAVGATAERDPLFVRLRRAARPAGTVVDVGAGTGRFALALAPRVAEVVAVDPSRAMLGVLTREARRLGLANVRCVQGRWQDVEVATAAGAPGAPPGAVPRADVVVCSYVLPLVPDAAPFLVKMDAACRGRAFVYLNAMGWDAVVDPFWRHFHGRPRAPAPTYLDAVAVLGEIGVEADVEVVEVRTTSRYKTLTQAVSAYRDNLLLPDTPEVRADLRRLLGPWLVDDGGLLRPPVRTTPAAIVSWSGRRR